MPRAAVADTVAVVLDQAKILRLPERVASIVIGNPAVADGTLQTGGLLVVTGKGYGTTHIIALDARGAVLAEHSARSRRPGTAEL
jgi:Flp pilus assembly secretin CpaC